MDTSERSAEAVGNTQDLEAFPEFFGLAEPQLRRALVAAYGSERGREATAEALAWAWEHWPELCRMDNPIGYLYRVGQSRTRPRKRRVVFDAPAGTEVEFEPALPRALAELSERQRVAVVLVHGYGLTHREVAELTQTSASSVQSHLERGLRRLRRSLEVTSDG
ncbi:MAG TPA: sigma-70 family RNA polymerase sigma factor [Acidimicrobiales bacterium]